MNTFERAFQAAVLREGFKKTKTLVDKQKHQFAQLYQAPDGRQYRLADAVVTMVRCDGQEK